MTDFPEIGYGTVHGRFLAGVLDDKDLVVNPTPPGFVPEVAPDAEPLSGYVTFSATAPVVRVVGATPAPATLFPQSLRVYLDEEGYLSRDNSRDITLWATDDPDGNPVNWQWRVTFSLDHKGHGVYHAPFNFELPAGTIVDLTVVAPLITPSPGTIIIQGPEGPAGPGITDLITAKGDMVAGTGFQTAAIISVGADGEYLTPEPTAETGLAWKPLPPGIETWPAATSATQIDTAAVTGLAYMELPTGFSNWGTFLQVGSPYTGYTSKYVVIVETIKGNGQPTSKDFFSQTIRFGVGDYNTGLGLYRYKSGALSPWTAWNIGFPVPEPIYPSDAATRNYVDARGLSVVDWANLNNLTSPWGMRGFIDSNTLPADIGTLTGLPQFDGWYPGGPIPFENFGGGSAHSAVSQRFWVSDAGKAWVIYRDYVDNYPNPSSWEPWQTHEMDAPPVVVPPADEVTAGIARYATQAEVDAGADVASTVRPSTLAPYVAAKIGEIPPAPPEPAATETVAGVARYSTQAEVDAGTDLASTVRPGTLAPYVAGQIAAAPVPPHTHPEIGGTHRFLFDTTPIGDPGSGKISVENVGGQNRHLRVSKTDADGGAVNLAVLAVNDSVALSGTGATPTIYARGYAATVVTDSGTWWEFTVVRESGVGALPADGTALLLNVTLANGAGTSVAAPWAPNSATPPLIVAAGSPEVVTDETTPGLILHGGNGTIRLQQLGASYLIRHTGEVQTQINLMPYGGTGAGRGPLKILPGETVQVYTGTDPSPITNITPLGNPTYRATGGIPDPLAHVITDADGGKIFGTGAGIWNVSLQNPGPIALSSPIVLWPLNSCVLTITPVGSAIGPTVITAAEGPVRVDWNYNKWVIEPMGKMNADKLLAPSIGYKDIPAGTQNYVDGTFPGFIRADGGATAQFVVNDRSYIIRHTGATSQAKVNLGIGTGEVTGHRGPTTLAAGQTAIIDIVDRIMHVSLHDDLLNRPENRLDAAYTITPADAGKQFWTNNGDAQVSLPLPPSGTLGFFPFPVWFFPDSVGKITFVPLDGTTIDGPTVVTSDTGPVRLDYFGNKWRVERMYKWNPTVPASATALGAPGDSAYDADWMYVCVATNTWKRTPLTTW